MKCKNINNETNWQTNIQARNETNNKRSSKHVQGCHLVAWGAFLFFPTKFNLFYHYTYVVYHELFLSMTKTDLIYMLSMDVCRLETTLALTQWSWFRVLLLLMESLVFHPCAIPESHWHLTWTSASSRWDLNVVKIFMVFAFYFFANSQNNKRFLFKLI